MRSDFGRWARAYNKSITILSAIVASRCNKHGSNYFRSNIDQFRDRWPPRFFSPLPLNWSYTKIIRTFAVILVLRHTAARYCDRVFSKEISISLYMAPVCNRGRYRALAHTWTDHCLSHCNYTHAIKRYALFNIYRKRWRTTWREGKHREPPFHFPYGS